MLCRLTQKQQTSVRILKERREGCVDEDKKAWRRRKMTLKGSHKLIDALQYLRISGSFMAASTEVSVCVWGGKGGARE